MRWTHIYIYTTPQAATCLHAAQLPWNEEVNRHFSGIHNNPQQMTDRQYDTVCTVNTVYDRTCNKPL